MKLPLVSKHETILTDIAARRYLPTSVNAQISRRCNLKCSMCGWHIWGRNKGVMSDQIFDRILEEMKANHIAHLTFSGAQGEPLLAPNCGDFLNRAIASGIKVEINTNCTPLGDRNIAMLAKAATTGKLRLQLSFSGYNKASYEAIYVGAKFEDSSRKLKACYDAFKSVGRTKDIAIRGCIIDNSPAAKHAAYVAELGVDVRDLASAKFFPNDNFGGLVKSNRIQKPTHFCKILAYGMIVYDDGKVSACPCRDSEGALEIGDIMKESFLEMRNGPRFQKLVNAFSKLDVSDIPLCRTCDLAH